MISKTVFLSKPFIILPEQKFSNKDVIEQIRSNYQGEPDGWQAIEEGIRYVFDRCDSQYRYLDLDPKHRVADYAVKACRSCLEQTMLDVNELNMVVYGGIAREYFEPSTAMEVSGKLGAKQLHAVDVTSACAGMLEGVQLSTMYLSTKDSYHTSLVCSAELTRNFLSIDIQSPEELVYKVAGLTIGNAAAAWLVSDAPTPGGCMRIVDIKTHSLPEHWELCSVPIDGSFTSFSKELFKLNVHCAPKMKEMLDNLGWEVSDVDHFIIHQPSRSIVEKVLNDLGADPNKAVFCHHLYGNTSSTTLPLAMHRHLSDCQPKAGDKFMFMTAAAGFTIVTATGEWVE